MLSTEHLHCGRVYFRAITSVFAWSNFKSTYSPLTIWQLPVTFIHLTPLLLQSTAVFLITLQPTQFYVIWLEYSWLVISCFKCYSLCRLFNLLCGFDVKQYDMWQIGVPQQLRLRVISYQSFATAYYHLAWSQASPPMLLKCVYCQIPFGLAC